MAYDPFKLCARTKVNRSAKQIVWLDEVIFVS